MNAQLNGRLKLAPHSGATRGDPHRYAETIGSQVLSLRQCRTGQRSPVSGLSPKKPNSGRHFADDLLTGDARLECLSYCLPMLLRVTLPFAAAHFVNQAARTVMAIVGPVLAVELGLSAVELGTLAACMFAAYAVTQLPLGVALDAFGARRVQ
eukprot:gene3128-4033_t